MQLIGGFQSDLGSVLAGMRSATADIQRLVRGSARERGCLVEEQAGHICVSKQMFLCALCKRELGAAGSFRLCPDHSFTSSPHPGPCRFTLRQVLDKMQQLQEDWQPRLDKLDVA